MLDDYLAWGGGNGLEKFGRKIMMSTQICDRSEKPKKTYAIDRVPSGNDLED